MALRVCQLCAVDFTVEKFLIPLIDGMSNEGWEVTTVCSDGPNVQKLRQLGYKIDTIEINRSINPIKAIKSFFLLFNYFKQKKFHVIHVHTPVAALIARVAARFSCNSYIIYTAHGFYFHDGMTTMLRSFFINLEVFAGKFTNILFCQSKEDSLDAIKYKIMPSNNVITIGNGVDFSKFNFLKYENEYVKIKNELGLPLNSKIVGIVARKVKEKGYVEFLEAACSLIDKHENIYVLIVGDKLKSDHNDGITKALDYAKGKFSNRILDLGLRNDIPRLISVMDIFCLPSHREGLPRTIIEAMILKKPVVATNIRGCREQVINGETGLLVPVLNSVKLEEAINYLIEKPTIAIEMGEKAFSIAKKKYDEKNVVKLQIDIIKSRVSI